MTKIAYIVRRERKGPKGWEPAPTDRPAQRFAVYRETTSGKTSGRAGLTRSLKFIEAFSNVTLANESALRRTRLVNGGGVIPQRTLGQRFGPIGKVIAGSINSPWAKGERS